MSRTSNRLVLCLGLALCSGFWAPSCDGKSSAAATPVAEARAAAVAGDLEGALRMLREERARTGLTAELGLVLGGVHEALGQRSEAVVVYRETTEAFPGTGAAELRLAEIFGSLGQDQAGVDRLLLARKAGEPDSEVSLPLAVAYGKLGRFDDAAQELDRAEAADVDASIVKYNRALLKVQAGEPAKALELLESALAASPEDPSILREVARLELELAGGDAARIASAEEHINRSISIAEAAGREDWRGYEVLGDCFHARGDHQAASQMYLKAKEIGLDPLKRLDDKYYDMQVLLRAEASAAAGGN